MKKKIRTHLFFSSILAITVVGIRTAPGQGTAFTYQGRLSDNGSAANGSYDLQFYLRDAATDGNPVGPTNTLALLAVSNGLFTASLNFGSVFDGNPRYLEIGVRTNGSLAAYATLSPRQLLTPAPYAIFANTASNLSGTVSAGQLSGTVGNSQLANSTITVNAGPGLSGGGTAALGGSTALFNSGVLAVAGNSDITASTSGGVVTLGDTATDANTASKIVKRDASGNFSASTISLNANLSLPTTTGTAGTIYAGGSTLLHDFGTNNFFAGVGAGNLTMTGTDNTGIGFNALHNNTTGIKNTANGDGALYNNTSGSNNTAGGFQALYSNKSGFNNTAYGQSALFSNSNGWENTASGALALYNNTVGLANTANGFWALVNNTSGNYNTASGDQALAHNSTGSASTAIGWGALINNTTGHDNTALGLQALLGNTSGFNNIGLGENAGFNITTGNNNICIGNVGLSSDNNVIRIGSGQAQAIIAGALTGNGSGLTNLSVAAANLTGTVSNGQLANNSIAIAAGTGLSGGGIVTLGGATTLNNTGVLSVTGNADITVSTTGGAVALGDTATNAAKANSVVKRDANGSFSATNITLSGNLNLPDTTTNGGIIYSGTNPILHAYGAANLFVGLGAGNFMMSGSANTAVGYQAGYNIATGSNNICIGNPGDAADTNVIRIGTNQTQTFIAGISGVTAASGVAVYVNPSGQLGTLTSSARFKRDIRRMDDASEALYALRPVTFHYKPELDPQAIPQFGLVAEEVEEVDPKLVARDDQDRPYTVRYEAVNAMLLNEFLKEHRKVEAQHIEIEELKARLEKLEQSLDAKNVARK